jgi:hypothetical protein
MATAREVISLDDLVSDIQKSLRPFGRNVTINQVTVKPYCYDNRIGWDTHVVIIEGYGVYGFTDGPLSSCRGKVYEK